MTLLQRFCGRRRCRNDKEKDRAHGSSLHKDDTRRASPPASVVLHQVCSIRMLFNFSHVCMLLLHRLWVMDGVRVCKCWNRTTAGDIGSFRIAVRATHYYEPVWGSWGVGKHLKRHERSAVR